MPRQPRLTARELMTALRRANFALVRVKGSHHFMAHADGRATVVPVHRGEILGPGLLRAIMSDCDLTIEQLNSLL